MTATAYESGSGILGEEQAIAHDAFPLNATSNVYGKSLLVKSGPGRLFGISGYSSSASAQFILVFDASTVPSNNAVPVLIGTAGAASTFSYGAGHNGRHFFIGIVVCNSSTANTLTLGSADTWFDVQYV